MVRKFLMIILAATIFSSKVLCVENAISPNRFLNATIIINKDGLSYCLKYKNTQISKYAPLGIEVNNIIYGTGKKLNLIDKVEIKENYNSMGNISINSHYNQYSYSIDSHNDNFVLQIRMYNDGFAYRYLIKNKSLSRINKELSGFNLANGTKVWYFERNNQWKLKTYAGEWLKTDIDSLYVISKMGPIQGPPLVAELPNNFGYMAITEAGLYNYSGMRLEAKQDGSVLVNFTEKEGFNIAGDITTPWRVMIFAKTLNELVNTKIITNLNPPLSKELFSDQTWIKPGRSVWSWWSYSENKEYMTIESERKFIDFANKLNFEYTLIDEGWETKWKNKWDDLRNICEYARNRNVGVWVWKHWNQLNNPNDNYKQMANFLDSIKTVGCIGIKVDFLNGEALQMVSFEESLLKLAAKRKLLVNIHGCGKPTGEQRTYPNELTREAVRGLELNKMDQHITASHNAGLPFTRCLLNQCDYTPMGFSNPGNTTWAHQLATAYLFTSSLLVMAENPEFLFTEKKLEPIIPFIKSLPTVWDETKVLKGSKIGELAVFARRKGVVWYLIALNGGKGKEFSCKLDFTGFKNNSVHTISDVQKDSKNIKLTNLTLRKGEFLSFQLADNGGFVAQIEQK